MIKSSSDLCRNNRKNFIKTLAKYFSHKFCRFFFFFKFNKNHAYIIRKICDKVLT